MPWLQQQDMFDGDEIGGKSGRLNTIKEANFVAISLISVAGISVCGGT